MPPHLPPAAAPARSTPPVLQPGLPRRRTPTAQRVNDHHSKRTRTQPWHTQHTTQPEGGDSAAKPSLTLRPHPPVLPQYHRNRCSKTSGLSAPLRRNPHFWAARLTALGVADTPIPLRELSADHLAAALRHAVNEPAWHHRAQTLATQLATEDGAARVLHTVQRFAVPT